MADPFSVAGLGLSVASLTFELFSGCVTAFKLLLEAKNMPQAYRHLLIRLQMEKDKLLGWAVLAQLSESEDSLHHTLRLSKHTIHDALREMQVLLSDTSKLKLRYSLQLEPVGQSDHDEGGTDDGSAISSPKLPRAYMILEEKALNLFEKTRKCPKRLRWAAFDKTKFEELLRDVSALNENMMQFLTSYQLDQHYKMQEATFMQVLQVNNRVDDLFHLFKSLQESAASRPSISVVCQTSQVTYDQRAMRMTRFKAINLSVEAGKPLHGQTGIQDSLLLDRSKLNLVLGGSQGDDQDRPPRSLGTFAQTPVWVEWRYYQPVYDDDDENEEHPRAPASVQRRISKMAKLLCDAERPQEFYIPTCLGFVQDEKQNRLGFLFEAQSREKPVMPMSLSDALDRMVKPSLTTRVLMARRLAHCIWYLHSTQWLHKGLRSENVVFGDGEDGLDSPALCGFDYSRPADLDETTERPLENPWFDLYRHPRTQFNVPREGRNGFQKSYDVYSLGVVLYEIAAWKPIHVVLGLDRKQRPKAATVKGVQTQLLSQKGISGVESEAGDVFAGIVKFCLSAEAVDDLSLQLKIWERVMMAFDGMVV